MGGLGDHCRRRAVGRGSGSADRDPTHRARRSRRRDGFECARGAWARRPGARAGSDGDARREGIDRRRFARRSPRDRHRSGVGQSGQTPQMKQTDLRHLEAFLEMLSAERGAAVHTLEAYRRDLLDYAGFLTKKGRGLVGGSAADVRAYLATLSDAGLKASTQARRLSAMRQLHHFLLDEDIRADDPTSAVESPKRGRPLPKIVSEAQTESLIDAAASLDGPEAIRLLCIVELLYASGLRVSELVTLPLVSVSGERRTIM